MLWISLYFISTGKGFSRPEACLPLPGLKQALEIAQTYTPKVARLADSPTLMLEVQASLALFDGPAALCRHLRAALRQQQLQPVLAMAPTAQGAQWLAQQTAYRQRRCLTLATLHQCLNRLPIAAIPSLEPWHVWLDGIGCRFLGQLRQLPRPGLQQRTGPGLLHQLDTAYAVTPEAHTWEPTPEQFNQTLELDFRQAQAPGLLGPLQHLVRQCCQWLGQQQRACRQLHFHLHHEKGRKAQPPTPLLLAVSEPSWQPDDFLPILKEKLNACQLPAPVISVSLHTFQTQPRIPRKTSLFPEPGQWQRNESQLFDLLQARLGPDSLLRPQPQASYLPEKANLWASKGTVLNEPPAGWPQRPFWLLAQPQPLSVAHNRPVHNHLPLTVVQGPERIESGWWESGGHQARDYFIAQDAQGVHYWVFRTSPSRAGVTDGRWYLQGLFA